MGQAHTSDGRPIYDILEVDEAGVVTSQYNAVDGDQGGPEAYRKVIVLRMPVLKFKLNLGEPIETKARPVQERLLRRMLLPPRTYVDPTDLLGL